MIVEDWAGLLYPAVSPELELSSSGGGVNSHNHIKPNSS